MRRAAAIGVLIGVLGAAGATARAQDVLSIIGLTPLAARVAVNTVISNGLDNPGLPAKAFRLLPPSARAEAATAGMAWLRSYTASPEFAQQYTQTRAAHKPSPPQFAGTPENELAKADEEQKQQAEESRKAIASLPPDQRAQIEEALKAAQAMSAQANTPEMRKMRLAAVTAERAERTHEYEARLASWRRDYPENPAPVLAKRLREFLAISADVDFAATVVARDGKMRFERDAYEEKPPQWKMCYRAGREATSAARAAAQAWLKDLGG